MERGWARPDSRTARTRHYFVGGRSLCRVWGTYTGIKLEPNRKPGTDCIRCTRTLDGMERNAEV
jgi:hypothetical protein